MFCSNCGKQNPDDAKFCASCGHTISGTTSQQNTPPVQYPAPFAQQTTNNMAPPAAAQRTSGFAITSLVLGILGLSLFAIIFGAVALGQIGKNPNLSGKGMAIAGLVLGIIGFLIELFIIIAAIGVATIITSF